jgi:predicted nucleotidyltransferase
MEALFPAMRRAILATLLVRPEQEWYFRDLAKHLGVQPSSLTRELRGLSDAGILRRRKDGNRVYYQADPACPFLPELRGLMLKTAGLVDVLREALLPFETRIVFAFVYGSMASGRARADSDVDLLIVGRTGRFELAKALRSAEQRLTRPINTVLYKPEEFARKAADHHFIRSVLGREKLFVIGDEHDLERTRKREAHRR